VQRPSTPHRKEQHYRHHRRNKPQEHIDQVDPHCILHPFDPIITLRILMDVQLAEDSEDGRP